MQIIYSIIIISPKVHIVTDDDAVMAKTYNGLSFYSLKNLHITDL